MYAFLSLKIFSSNSFSASLLVEQFTVMTSFEWTSLVILTSSVDVRSLVVVTSLVGVTPLVGVTSLVGLSSSTLILMSLLNLSGSMFRRILSCSLFWTARKLNF